MTSGARRARQSDAIIEATLNVLRRHGYRATSLQRIADETGTSKRMVLHYFGTRDQLFDEVVRRVSRRVLAQVEQAVLDVDDPDAALLLALDGIWNEVLQDPGLHAVFFGLVADSVTDPTHRTTITTVREEYREMVRRVVADSSGFDRDRLDSTATLVLATMAGLTIDRLERGDTPELHRAFEDFKGFLATQLRAAEPAR